MSKKAVTISVLVPLLPPKTAEGLLRVTGFNQTLFFGRSTLLVFFNVFIFFALVFLSIRDSRSDLIRSLW